MALAVLCGPGLFDSPHPRLLGRLRPTAPGPRTEICLMTGVTATVDGRQLRLRQLRRL